MSSYGICIELSFWGRAKGDAYARLLVIWCIRQRRRLTGFMALLLDISWHVISEWEKKVFLEGIGTPDQVYVIEH